MIRLYRAPWSTNCERVALALARKDLEVESVLIDYSDRSPVERVSGQPLVPVIVDGDQVVFDSIAILRHLDERYPDDDELFHRILDEYQDVAGRPRLEAWIDRVDALPREHGRTVDP